MSSMPFSRFDSKIQKLIMRHVLVSDHTISPFDQHRSEAPEGQGTVEKKNYDTALLSTNRHLNVEASNILYGENNFRFHEPSSTKRFLDQIDPTNVSKLNTVTLVIGDGPTQPFDRLTEHIWVPVLRLLREQHRLRHLSVILLDWEGTFSHWGKPRGDPQFHATGRVQLRIQAVLRELRKYRGIPEVVIDGSPFLPFFYMNLLAKLMSRP